jgi:hypothetical protein
MIGAPQQSCLKRFARVIPVRGLGRDPRGMMNGSPTAAMDARQAHGLEFDFSIDASSHVPPPLPLPLPLRLEAVANSLASSAAPLDPDSGPATIHTVTKPKSTSRWVIVASGAFGFFAGAVCWHVIGFWWFVSDVMFHRRTEVTSQIARPASSPPKAQSRQAGVAGPMVAASSDRCSAVVREPDRGVGTIKIVACEGGGTKLRGARNVQRADYADFGPTPVPTLISGAPTVITGADAVSVGGWSARIEKADR